MVRYSEIAGWEGGGCDTESERGVGRVRKPTIESDSAKAHSISARFSSSALAHTNTCSHARMRYSRAAGVAASLAIRLKLGTERERERRRTAEGTRCSFSFARHCALTCPPYYWPSIRALTGATRRFHCSVL
jgi:hypothetical protein